MVTIATDALIRLNGLGPRFDALVNEASPDVASWQQFYFATAERPLLARLSDYRDALLVAGCDWPAATAVTRLFKRLPCFADSRYGHDDELDGALLLAGLCEPQHLGRRCFQTNYVGQRLHEYFDHADYRLVWIVREPRAAICSLLGDRQRKSELAGGSACAQGASRLEKACATYLTLIQQTLELKQRLGSRVAIVDYDALTADRTRVLPALCRFASVGCNTELLSHLHGKSVRRGMLASWEASIVDELALPAYRSVLAATYDEPVLEDGAGSWI